jgi:diamine N-acetyltransferase
MISIRPAEEKDFEQLLALAERTFVDTYAVYNTPENMELHIQKTYNLTNLREELTVPHAQYSLVFDDKKLVAYCKVRCALHPPELEGRKHIELERIYVDKACKGEGIGRKMIEYCSQNALNDGFEVFWLGVWSENPKAIAFYKKMNFEQFGTHSFLLGDDEQVDFLMKIELNFRD